jgi:uncharacterized membrane protein YsdA (DUF1294 family)/cold shock CspA family protein
MSSAPGSHKGRIVDWNKERGFGYLDSGGKRIFLHWREFKERHKRPEVGDVILFALGEDQQGRPCAKEAVHASDGGRLRAWHGLLVASLLLPPGYAAYSLTGWIGLGYAGSWVLLLSALTFGIFYLDKAKARKKQWREPERHLHLLELLGGWPGSFLAQRRFRHKASKGTYQFIFILIVGLHQFLAIDALRGWPLVKSLLGLTR